MMKNFWRHIFGGIATSIYFLTLVFLPVQAQDTITLTCQNRYQSSSGPWTGSCDDPDFCTNDTVYLMNDDACIPVTAIDACETISFTRDWSNGAYYCRDDVRATSTTSYYCCNASNSSLFDEEDNDDIVVEDRVSCGSSELLDNFLSYDSVDEAKADLDCVSATDEDFVNGSCETSDRCDIDSRSFCCPGSPPVKSTDSNYGCKQEDFDSVEEFQQCQDCLYDGEELTGAVWTELGCIDPSPTGLVTRIFQIGLGIMGGVAVLRFIQIAFAYQTGDQEKVKEAQEMTTSLIAGIILLVLGVLILQFIGVSILGLPEGTFGG